MLFTLKAPEYKSFQRNILIDWVEVEILKFL
jgi:hypothetical protein